MSNLDESMILRKISDLKKQLLFQGYKEIRHLSKDIRFVAVDRLDVIFSKFFTTMIKMIDQVGELYLDGDTVARITQDIHSCSRNYYPGYFAKVTGEDIFRRLTFDFKNPTHLGRRIE